MNLRILYWHVHVRRDPFILSVSFNRFRWLTSGRFPTIEVTDDFWVEEFA